LASALSKKDVESSEQPQTLNDESLHFKDSEQAVESSEQPRTLNAESFHVKADSQTTSRDDFKEKAELASAHSEQDVQSSEQQKTLNDDSLHVKDSEQDVESSEQPQTLNAESFHVKDDSQTMSRDDSKDKAELASAHSEQDVQSSEQPQTFNDESSHVKDDGQTTSRDLGHPVEPTPSVDLVQSELKDLEPPTPVSSDVTRSECADLIPLTTIPRDASHGPMDMKLNEQALEKNDKQLDRTFKSLSRSVRVPRLQSKPNMVFSPDGSLLDHRGEAICGEDGLPLTMADVLTGSDGAVLSLPCGKPITENDLFFGPDGMLQGPNGMQVLEVDGSPLDSSVLVLHRDGSPKLNHRGRPMRINSGPHTPGSPSSTRLGSPSPTPIDPPSSGEGDVHPLRLGCSPRSPGIVNRVCTLSSSGLFYDSGGAPIVDRNGNHIHLSDVWTSLDGVPLLGRDGRPITKHDLVCAPNGVVLGSTGVPWNGPRNQPITRSDLVCGPTGKPVLGENGSPLIHMPCQET